MFRVVSTVKVKWFWYLTMYNEYVICKLQPRISWKLNSRRKEKKMLLIKVAECRTKMLLFNFQWTFSRSFRGQDIIYTATYIFLQNLTFLKDI